MKLQTVYSLREELARDPDYVQRVQELSLDTSRPTMGLSARLGLYGSDEWWRNVDSGAIPRAHFCGVIVETFYEGMDSDRRHNAFRMQTDDGREYSYSMIPKNGSGKGLYRVGHRAEITTIFQELKSTAPDGTTAVSESPLEIKLATTPIT